MKKLSLIALLLIVAFNLNGQSLSPYLPVPYVSATANQDETQMTYFDLNFVNSKLRSFLEKGFSMAYAGAKQNLNEGKGTITQKFTKTGSNEELSFAFDVQTVGDEFLITQVKIIGSASQVSGFYTKYWTNAMTLDASNGETVATNKLLQDDISYHPNNGKPYIEITNSTIPDAKTFLDKMKAKEAGWSENSEQELAEIAEAQQAHQNKLEAEREKKAEQVRAKNAEEKTAREAAAEQAQEREKTLLKKQREDQLQTLERQAKLQEERAARYQEQQTKNMNAAKERKLRQAKADTLRNTFDKKLLFDVLKSNKDLKISLKTAPGNNENLKILDLLKKRLSEFVADRKEGTYVILAQYKRVYEDIKRLEFKVRKFNKLETKED